MSSTITAPLGFRDTSQKPIVDGFTYSLSRTVAADSYYSQCVAQLELLRRANGYRAKWHTVPDDIGEPVPAFGQLEYQVNVQPGSYLWAYMFAITQDTNAPTDIYVQVTDACTETPMFSDYARGSIFAENTSGIGTNRPPCLLSQPYLIGDPGLINVEIYNKAATDTLCQLVLLFAEPELPPEQMKAYLRQRGVNV